MKFHPWVGSNVVLVALERRIEVDQVDALLFDVAAEDVEIVPVVGVCSGYVFMPFQT